MDDDHQIQNLLRVYLSENGFHSVSVHHPMDIAAALDRHAPDVVLLDVGFPGIDDGLDGLEAIAALQRLKFKGKSIGIPVIVISAHHDTETVKRAEKLNVQWFMVKPFDLTLLVERIRSLIS